MLAMNVTRWIVYGVLVWLAVSIAVGIPLGKYLNRISSQYPHVDD